MGPAGRNTKGTGSQVPLSFFQPFRPSRIVPSAFRWQRYPGGELSRQPRAREAGAGRRAARALTSRRRRTTPALPTPARVRFPAGALTAGQGTCAVLHRLSRLCGSHRSLACVCFTQSTSLCRRPSLLCLRSPLLFSHKDPRHWI